MYFLPPPQLGVCFQKSTGDWDFKGSTFPSNLRTPPLPVLVFGKQSQSKAKTCYLLSHLLCKVFPWKWQRGPSTISKGEGSTAESCSFLSGLQRQISHFSQISHLGNTTSEGVFREFCPSQNLWKLRNLHFKKTFPAAKWKYSSSSVCGHHFRVLMLKPGPQETPPFLHKSFWFHINF